MHIAMHKTPPTVSVILDTRRKTTTGKNAGKYSIKLRVTFCVFKKGKKAWPQRVYPTGYYATESEFKSLMAGSRVEALREIKRELVALQNHVNEKIQKYDITDQESFELHLNSSGSVEMIDGMFERKIAELEANDQISAAEKYRTALTVIRKFAGGDVYYSEVNPAWLNKFLKWYTAKGRSVASYSFHARALRHIFKMAIAHSVISSELYPFGPGKFIIPSVRRPLKRYLNVEEKDLFLNYKSDDDRLMMYHDFWVFSFYCNGMNFADVLNLKRKDIFPEYILIDRQKTATTDRTKKKIVIPVNDEILAIIGRRGNKTLNPKDYVFPILNHDMTAAERFNRVRMFVMKTNRALDVIRRELGIADKVTTYTARHTYSYVMLTAGMSTELLQDSLGHGDITTTEHYKHGFSLDVKKKFAKLLAPRGT